MMLPSMVFPEPADTDARILIIDSVDASIELFMRALEHGGYTNIVTLREAEGLLEAVESFQPHLLVLGIAAPDADALAFLAALKREAPEELPVLVISSAAEADLKQQSLALGASGYLSYPFEPLDLAARADDLIRLQRLYARLMDDNIRLVDEVLLAAEAVEQVEIEMLARLARLADHRDVNLSEHTWRVARLSGNIARALGQAPEYVNHLRRAARLHDIGKVAVPDYILTSSEPLTDEEWVIMRRHPEVGARILSGGGSELLVMAEQIALTHHERWDGNGYPRGLKGEAIPLEGRIVAVADAFDAMTSNRPYRSDVPVRAAIEELHAAAGTQFDPAVVNAMVSILVARNQSEKGESLPVASGASGSNYGKQAK